MKEVQIQLENGKLIDLGLESEVTYAPLRFNESHFVGYWINSDDNTIIFYLTGGKPFLCANNSENIAIFETILNGNNGKKTIL